MLFSIEELKSLLVQLNTDVTEASAQRKLKSEGATEALELLYQRLLDKKKEHDQAAPSESNTTEGPSES